METMTSSCSHKLEKAQPSSCLAHARNCSVTYTKLRMRVGQLHAQIFGKKEIVGSVDEETSGEVVGNLRDFCRT